MTSPAVNQANFSNIDQTLKSLGLALPTLSKPVASYVPFVVTGNMVYISGQLPLGTGPLEEHMGQLGNGFSVEKGKKVAEICTLNVIAQLKEACGGDLNKVKRCVKLVVFVNSSATFTDQPTVANGASELIVKLFGSRGEHARSAVGVSQLPRGVAVEVEAIFEIA